jgi:PAS domain S-box-containing protein
MLESNDIQITCNEQGEILRINTPALNELGSQLIGKPITNIITIPKAISFIENAFVEVNILFNKVAIKALAHKQGKEYAYQFKGKENEEENRFKFLSDVAIEAIAMTHNKIIIDCNEQFVSLYGYNSIEEVIGLKIDDFVEPEHREFVNGLLKKNEIDKVEITNRKKDGTPVIIESKGSYMNYQGKRVRVSVMYDITERKKTEQTLIEKERSIQTLMSHLPGMAYRCLLNDDLSMEYVSQGSKNLTGYEQEEIIAGRKIQYQTLVQKEFQELRKSKLIEIQDNIFSLEYKIKSKEGVEKWVWERGEVLAESDNKKTIEGFISDITNRKNYEKSNEQFKNLVEQSPDGILIHTAGKIIYANPKALKLLEINHLSEISGLNFEGIFTRYCDRFLKEEINKIIQIKGLDYVEITYQNKTGEFLEWGVNSINSWYAGKQVVQTTLTDITIEKRLNQEQVRLKVTQELNDQLTIENYNHITTQSKLKEAEQFSRSIIDSSLDMIIAIDSNGIITNFNKSAEKTLGYKAKELIGRHVNMVYDSNYDFLNVRNALKEKGEFYGEVINKNKKGITFTTLLSASLIKNSDGKVVGSMGISRDITRIKQAEQDIKVSERKYRELLENISEYIISIDLEGNFLYVNNSFKRAMGYSDQDFKNKKLKDMLSPDRAKQSEITIKSIVEGKTLNPVSTSFITQSGKKIIIQGNTTVKYKHYQPISIRGIFKDVTENLKTAKLVKIQSAKMKSIFENSTNILLWMLNEKQQITSMNQKFKKTIWKYCELEISEGAFFDKELSPFIQKGYFQELMHKKFSLAFLGNSQQFEVCMVDTYNELVWFEVFINPIILDDDKKIREVSCMAYEINDRKEAELKIEKALLEKDILLKEIHHRVKNNLQVISSILNLQSSLVTDEKTLAILRESQSRIRTMSYIHESLYRTKDFNEINFKEYLTNLSKNLVSSYVVGKKVSLKLNINELHLNLDQAIPCGLIVNEVVTNSLKYAFTNQNDAEITVEVHEDNDEISLIMGDNGIGMPENFRSKTNETLGVQLIEALTEQLDGNLQIENLGGTKYLITFRKQI